jgi:hypothetical protein
VDLLDIGRAPEKVVTLNFFADRRDERMLALLHRQQ